MLCAPNKEDWCCEQEAEDFDFYLIVQIILSHDISYHPKMCLGFVVGHIIINTNSLHFASTASTTNESEPTR